MSAADLSTGFFGKIPATGDFVGRRLPADFVRVWDRWVARHLAPLLASDMWADHVGLRFLFGPAAFGPMAGIVLPSADRVGRRFPLTIAAPTLSATTGLVDSAAGWFEQIQQVGTSAQRGDIDAGQFAAELAGLPFPDADTDGESIDGMVFWISASDLIGVDQDAPHAALDYLLAASLETG